MDTNKPQSPVLSERLRVMARPLTNWFGAQGARLGIDPDVITLLGMVVVLIAAWLAAQGHFFAAGIVLILGAPLDTLDGAIARAINRKNRFGALLDSTLDRYADAFMFAGIAYYFAARGQLNEMALALVALIGAYGVSYVRARAEGLDIRSIKEGFFDRVVRTIILIVMLLTGLVVPGLVILAIGNHITAIQRILIVYRITRADGQ
ncbi:MAG: CDP-alcohol phosphatidyltransferase family protein [Anaerolineae bacterium]|nr:CDP-alcohol phosphatidyltransferase family protein [Anaerolineae bacterium]